MIRTYDSTTVQQQDIDTDPRNWVTLSFAVAFDHPRNVRRRGVSHSLSVLLPRQERKEKGEKETTDCQLDGAVGRLNGCRPQRDWTCNTFRRGRAGGCTASVVVTVVCSARQLLPKAHRSSRKNWKNRPKMNASVGHLHFVWRFSRCGHVDWQIVIWSKGQGGNGVGGGGGGWGWWWLSMTERSVDSASVLNWGTESVWRFEKTRTWLRRVLDRRRWRR